MGCDKMEEAVGRFSVSCKFISVSDQFVWAFIGVYGPNVHRDRKIGRASCRERVCMLV